MNGNLISVPLGDWQASETTEDVPETRDEKKTAGKSACCLFRGVSTVRKDDTQTLHDLSSLTVSVLAQAHLVGPHPDAG